MNITGGTDIGSVRSANEDYYKIFKFDDNSFCAVVADGMGGHKGGKVASSVAASHIVDYIRTNISSIEITEENVFAMLKKAIAEANELVYMRSLSDSELSGMGTTVVAVVYVDGVLYAANVGDSRIYEIGESIRQISKDHSLVQDLIDKGVITEAEANSHPNKNIITRAVGTEKNVETDTFRLDNLKNKHILMCTDGLTNFVDDDTIAQIVKNHSSRTARDKLIELANENGGRDNITLIIIDFDEVSR